MEADRRVHWPAERSELLKQLWNQNLSAWVIAEQLGITKNAVIGKAHRLGLPSHKPVQRKPRKQAAAPMWRPKPRTKRAKAMVANGGEHKFLGRRLEQLGPNDCRYPYGDRPPFVFCAVPVEAGQSYCSVHCEACFVRVRGQPRVMRFTPTWGNAP